VAELFSQRFNKRIAITRHARLRMGERNIDDDLPYLSSKTAWW